MATATNGPDREFDTFKPESQALIALIWAVMAQIDALSGNAALESSETWRFMRSHVRKIYALAWGHALAAVAPLEPPPVDPDWVLQCGDLHGDACHDWREHKQRLYSEIRDREDLIAAREKLETENARLIAELQTARDDLQAVGRKAMYSSKRKPNANTDRPQ